MNAGVATREAAGVRCPSGACASGGRAGWIEPVAIVAGSFLAGLLMSLSGLMEDTAISFAVGLRLLDGQVAYRDFLIPHGPLGGWLAVPWLWALPTVGSAYLVAAGVLNAAAAWLIWIVVRHATQDRLAAAGAAAGTAVWFLQIGGYYHDQLAYVLILAAYAAFLRHGKSAFGVAAAAFLLVLAFHAKQTIGVFGAATFGIAAIVMNGWRFLASWRCLVLVVTYLAGQTAFLLYFVAAGLWENYFIYTWVVPSDFASADIKLSRLATDLVQPWSLNIVEIVRGRHWGQAGFYPMVGLVYGIYLVALLRWRTLRAEPVLAASLLFLVLSTIWSGALAARLYTHLTYGLCGAAAIALFVLLHRPGKAATWARPVTLSVVAGIVALGVLTGAVNNYILSRAPGAQASANSELWPLRRKYNAVQYDDVIAYLRQAGPGGVALIGARTLYIVQLSLRAAPSDPVAFYDRGLTVPRDPDLRRRWEATVTAALARRRPAFLVLTTEQIPWSTGYDLLSLQPFPALARYAASNYPDEVFRSNGMVVRRRLTAEVR